MIDKDVNVRESFSGEMVLIKDSIKSKDKVINIIP